MTHRRGYEAKMYRNTGTYDTPVWEEVTNIRDLTLGNEKGETDVTTRQNSGYEAVVGTLKRANVEFSMVWNTGDDDFTAIKDSYFNGTGIDVMVLDGSKDVSGTQGLRATMEVMTFNRNENLTDALTVDVTMKPTYSDHAPEWVTIE